MDRRERLCSLFDASGFGLEIGPSYSPVLPKSAGYRVETLDYASQEELRAKYRGDSVDIDRIEPVDYVSDGRPMREVIGAVGRYDFILASHVIEHTPDLVGFLSDCEALLKPGGVLVLALPDKRCCFDLMVPPTRTGEILDAHALRRTRPSPGAVFTQIAYAVKKDGATGWPLADTRDCQLAHDLATAARQADRVSQTNAYVDVHVWRFVPASFRLIIGDLRAIGAISLGIEAMHVSEEIVAVLSREAPVSGEDRLALMAEMNAPAPDPAARQAEAIADVARAERDAALSRLAEAEAEIEALADRVAALEGSTSWRLTAPMRALVQRTRG